MKLILGNKMKATNKNNVHVVILHKGDEVISSLTQYVTENRITSGTIQGIGALQDTEIGYFDVGEKIYLRKIVPESCELLNFQANISLINGKPFIHAHVILGNKDFSIQGGHCFAGVISVTGEFYIKPLGCEIHRSFDDDAKLNLISL